MLDLLLPEESSFKLIYDHNTPQLILNGIMETWWTFTIFLITCTAWLVLVALRSRNIAKGKLPPGPFSLPVIGNALQLKTSKLDQRLREFGEKYGPLYTLYFGSRRVVVLHGYDAIKETLIDQADEFSLRGTFPLAEKVNKGYGVVFSNGERWKQLRRFALTALRNYGMGKKTIEEKIQEEAQCLLERLRDTQGKPFDPTFFLSSAFSNIICSIVFGQRYEYSDQRFLTMMAIMNDNFQILNSLFGQLYNLFPTFMEFVPGPHLRTVKNVLRLRGFVLEEIKAHKSTQDPSGPRDFIDSFIIKMDQEKGNHQSEFTMENLVRTTIDLFAAGTETSSTTLRYGLLILMKYPHIQEKVQQEIDQIVGRGRCPCISDRAKMPYTDATIHEIQRFISLIPFSLPHATLRDIPFKQYIIPKGTAVYPLLSSVLHDSKEFPNPEKFNPEHFLHKDGTFRKSNYFMPFSAGKRMCVGEGLARMELFLFLTSILQNYTLKPTTPPSLIDITPQFCTFGNLPRSYQLSVLPR